MTFGVLGKDEPLLAQLIALAFESAGHDCVVFKDIEHASRVVRSLRIDSIVLAVRAAGGNRLAWLECLGAIHPDLPSRTLLLTHTALTSDESAQIEKLGANAVSTPASVIGVGRIVTERLQKAQLEARSVG